MSPTGDDLTRYAERHLAVLLAVMARVTSDPALAFDIATEALARGQRLAREKALAPADEPGHLRRVLEAAEHVFRASVESGRVSQVERLRTRGASPTVLCEQRLFEIGRLGRESLTEHRDAETLVGILQRDSPSPRELTTIARSTLVRTTSTADRHPDGRPDR